MAERNKCRIYKHWKVL